MKRLLIALSMNLLAAAAQAAPTPPDEVVKGTTLQLQTLIGQNHAAYKKDLEGFYKVVDEVLVKHFNVPGIARTVLGKNWKGASDEQRTRFAQAFKNMLIRSYANALLEYHDSVKAEWKPLRMEANATDVTVNSTLVRSGKQPIPVGFAMQLVDGAWKVSDITVENISLVLNFRGQISGEIKKTSLDAVITRMESGSYTTKAKGQQG